MASRETASTEILPSGEFDAPIDELEMKNRRDLENLTLAIQPIKTVQLFIFATCQYIRESVVYIFTRRVELFIMSMLIVAPSLLLVNADGPHEKLIHELFLYARFMLWWVALGVASSIGLGSGLHTFVLYLGPHIAFFTIKAMKCGRVDLKYAPYDTIQLKTGPSWLEKDCSEIGNPLFSSLPGSLVRVPLSSILPQVQLEAVLWGLGTALGELPPYFISRTAFLSGNKVDVVEDSDDASLGDDGFFSAFLRKMKRWILSHAQHLNFFTILILASVPNPLFDLAGIMCGQLGIPFWKFFLATLIGKAIIKTHIQTIFIISLCNNQLLEWMENELIWVLGHIPIISSLLPNLVAKLHMIQKKYLLVPSPTSVPDISDGMAKKWNLSFTMVWNTVIWLVLMNFLAKIVTTTAQSYLKKQQDLELHNRELSLKAKSEHTIQ